MPKAKKKATLDLFEPAISIVKNGEVPADATKRLIWAELDQGATSVSVFFVRPRQKKLVWQDGSDRLKLAVEAHWKGSHRRKKPWRLLKIAIDGSAITTRLVPPSEAPDDARFLDLRDEALVQFFGHCRVDYSAAGI